MSWGPKIFDLFSTRSLGMQVGLWLMEGPDETSWAPFAKFAGAFMCDNDRSYEQRSNFEDCPPITARWQWWEQQINCAGTKALPILSCFTALFVPTHAPPLGIVLLSASPFGVLCGDV